MLNSTSHINLTASDLVNYYKKGAKSEQTIGLEYEKLGVLPSSFEAVPYNKIEKFLEKLSEFAAYKRNFNNQCDKHLIGLNNDVSSITLEPGSQFELSVKPYPKLGLIAQRIQKHNELTKTLAENFGIKWIGSGLQPISTFKDINIIPKTRYKIMTRYLPTVAQLPLVMMRETAGIQVGIDYSSEEDAIEKLRLSLKLAPIISAVYSNSPIRNGKLSGYKSYRAYSWTKTDNKRCGLISKKLFDNNYNFTFSDYVDTICDIQMIMVNDNTTQIPVNNFTFNDFIKQGHNNRYPDLTDFIQHSSLYFTDSRLKQYLEIRNHDSQKSEYIMSIPAFWKAVMYNNDAFSTINNILKEFTYEDFEELRHKAPIYGLDCKISNRNVSELAKEIFNIAYATLKLTNEEKYLEPILELANDGITPADIIIKNFNGIWNRNIEKFINFSEV